MLANMSATSCASASSNDVTGVSTSRSTGSPTWTIGRTAPAYGGTVPGSGGTSSLTQVIVPAAATAP